MVRLAPWRAGLLSALLTLTACTSMTIYHRDGAEVSRIDTDLTACRASAQTEVPPDIRQRYIPPVYSYQSYCYPNGYCTSQRILSAPGYFTPYDANEGKRAAWIQSCMAQKGFSQISLPLCEGEVTRATTIRRTRVQPPITETSCIIRIRGGGYQIVTP